MKKVGYKSLVIAILLCSLYMTACSNKSEPSKQEETSGNETVSLFLEYAKLQEVALAGEDQLNLEYTNDGWVESNGNEIDQEETNRLLTTFVQLTGSIVEADKVGTIGNQEPFLTVTLTNENQEEKTVEMITDENGMFYAKESDELVYAVSQFPDEWQQFSLVMLQTPLELPTDTLEEIRYTDGKLEFVLNQETTLSEVETSPFISGWFLHSDLQTEFSVEYAQMEQVLAALTSLKGKVSEDVEQGVFTDPIQIDLIGNEHQETLLIGNKEASGQYTYVKTESDQMVYQVPDVLIHRLDLQPAEIIDNFISLLPLTAIESIEITDTNDTIRIEAKHEVVENEAEELEVASEFYVNGEKTDTAAFRKTYQYLAMLSYEEEIDDYSIPVEKVEEEIQIVYTFKDNGETLQHTIRFIPYAEGKYVVVKNGTAEFTTSSEQIDSMLEQLSYITKD